MDDLDLSGCLDGLETGLMATGESIKNGFKKIENLFTKKEKNGLSKNSNNQNKDNKIAQKIDGKKQKRSDEYNMGYFIGDSYRKIDAINNDLTKIKKIYTNINHDFITDINDRKKNLREKINKLHLSLKKLKNTPKLLVERIKNNTLAKVHSILTIFEKPFVNGNEKNLPKSTVETLTSINEQSSEFKKGFKAQKQYSMGPPAQDFDLTVSKLLEDDRSYSHSELLDTYISSGRYAEDNAKKINKSHQVSAGVQSQKEGIQNAPSNQKQGEQAVKTSHRLEAASMAQTLRENANKPSKANGANISSSINRRQTINQDRTR